MSPKADERAFENHFCHQLEVAKYQKRDNSDVDKDMCLNLKELIEFLEVTQQEELHVLKTELGQRWKQEIVNAFRQALKDKLLFEILRDGLQVYTQQLRLVYFKPQTSFNKDEIKRYKKNRFTYVRQYTINQKSIDIVLLLNGFAVVTIELKNNPTGQTINDAINQYLDRDLSLSIFNQPFVHIAADNEEAQYATNFENQSEDDFNHFNTGLINEPPDDREYATHYLYHDVLTPDSLLEMIQSYLYPKEKDKWIFPRYHQLRVVERIFNDIQERYLQTGQLNLRYLVQHSAGSGKRASIIWLVQRLRNLFVNDEKLFDIIIVITDRIILDKQLSDDLAKAIPQKDVVNYCKTSEKLSEGIKFGRKVIVSTIQKFSFIQEELEQQPNRRICLVIDEGHRSQDGKLHDTMTEAFYTPEQVIDEIARKEFPNVVFVALTATPSERTLQHFGTRVDDHWEPFDIYSMDEAIAEEHILDVVKNLTTYETLYELNYRYESNNEYPPLQIYRGLKLKAFEDDEVIKEKVKIMLTIFKQQTAPKIGGQAKAMVVTSSRLAAVKYKLFFDEAFKRENMTHKALVAFTGTIELGGSNYTEASMNGFSDSKTAEKFEKSGYRFMIVANKFQTGFDQPFLHTMFLDKSVSGINAVQTLSRLNRIYPPLKVDTLVVDFTDSYDDIIKAFKRFQGNVTSKKEVKPDDLAKIYNELLKKGVFTRGDVEEAIRLLDSDNPSATAELAGLMHRLKDGFKDKLDEEEQRIFRILLGRYVHYFDFVKSLFVIPDKGLNDFRRFSYWLYNYLNPHLSSEDLRRELEHVKLEDYRIRQIRYKVVGEETIENDRIVESSSIFNIKRLATVKEIVESINEKFAAAITSKDSQLLKKYLESVVTDEELLADVRSNLDNDSDVVYSDILEPKMKSRYSAFIISNAADRYLVLMNEDMLRFVNYSAYQVLRNVAMS